MENLAYLFPVKEKFAYFMTAGAGPLSRPACEAIQKFSEGSMNTGCLNFPDWLGNIEDATRNRAANLLKCDPRNIAFVKSTNHGLWIASRMLDWQPGDEVILPFGEFPANVYPWLSLEPLGVQIRWLENGGDNGSMAEVRADEVRKLINSKTRVLSVSFVQFDNGCRRDINELGRLCQERGITFVVDAIQGLGAVPLDSIDCRADFIASGCQKWLLSPHGLGLLYVKSKWLDSDKAPNMGTYSLSQPFDFGIQNYQRTLKRLNPGARRLEEAVPNFLALVALRENLEIMLSYGIDKIAGRIKQLTDRLVDGLKSLGFPLVSLREGNLWSGIVSFSCPGLDATEVREKLAADAILITGKGSILRASVHFFNDESEIDRLVNALSKLNHRAS
jgi:selenocysteine lyase/cysteine desulfurase